MTKVEWTGKGYPKEYVEDFEVPDWSAASHVAKHIKTKEPGVSEVVLTHGDGGSHVAVRYTGPEVDLDKGVNWSDPTKPPAAYSEYASTFWSLKGPKGRQTTRARILAVELGVELQERTKR